VNLSQRVLFLVAALYVSATACATEVVPAAGEPPTPHIALLLPLKSAAFGRAAKAVQNGFLAAANSQPQSLPIRVYECADESSQITALYQSAVANGARAVAGPLTRNGVAALAASSRITVPTLALNVSESGSAYNLYFFSLSAETEARQVAQLAAAAGLHIATIISNNTALSKRLAQAYAEEWKLRGNSIRTEIVYQDDPTALANIPAGNGNMVFLAIDADKAHLIRPYLNAALPVYATSQLFNGNADKLTNFDLNDIRFVDMPWLLQPEHPAVMIYPRANPPLEADMERLYALGIDAYRLLQILLDNNLRTALPLDGVTGSIQINSEQQFQRSGMPALFFQGRGITPEEAEAILAASMAVSGVPAASGVPASGMQ